MRLATYTHGWNLRRITAAMLMLAVTGCGGTRFANELKPYVGRDIHELVAHLGKPTGQRETADDRDTTAGHVYVWSTDSDGMLATNPFSAGPGDGGGVSYAGSATPSGLIPVQFQCTLEVTVDAHNLVQHTQFEGSNAGCARYRQMLKH